MSDYEEGHSANHASSNNSHSSPARDASTPKDSSSEARRATLQFRGLETPLGPQIEELAKMRGDQAPAVLGLASTFASNVQTEELIAATVERDSAVRTIRTASSKLDKALKKKEHVPAQIVEPGSTLEIGGFRLLGLILLVSGVAVSLWIENSACASILVGFEVLGLTQDSMWRARMLMATPIAASLTGLLFLKILPASLRKVLLVSSCFLFAASSVTWCIAFASETQRFRDEASNPFAVLENPEAAKPSESRMAIVLFACQALMMLLSPLLAHSGVEIVIEQSQSKVPNPDWLTVEDEICAHEKDIEVAQDRISEAERKVTILKSREAEFVNSALNLYKRLKMNTAVLIAVLLTGVGSNPSLAQHAVVKAEVRPSSRLLAISPQLTAEDKVQLKPILTREFEVMLNQPQGHTLEVVDAWTSQTIAKVENTSNSTRTRRIETAEQLRLTLEYLKTSGGNEKLDGRVHLPRLAHSLAQMRLPARTHVIVIGSPLFTGQGQDAHFSMINGSYPSDGCLFDGIENVFSTVGRSKRLDTQYWHLGWNRSDLSDEAQKLAVLRFWALYLGEQSACLVTGQTSIAAAIEAANKSATSKLVDDKPDRTSKPGMISVKWVVEEQSSVERASQKPIDGATDSINTIDDTTARRSVDRNADEIVVPLEEQVLRKPQVNVPQPKSAERTVNTGTVVRDRFKNPIGSSNDLVSDRQIAGERITILSLYRCRELDESPLYEALKRKGYEVVRLNAPIPDVVQFAKTLDATDQLWMISSYGSSGFTEDHARLINDRWQTGRLGLMLLCDNEPFVEDVNLLLKVMSKGQVSVNGNYPGMQYLEAGSESQRGCFDRQCPLFHNVETLFEGDSISNIQAHGKALKPVCWASSGKTLIATYEGSGRGRLIVHGGFTSFFSTNWTDAGVSRLAVNSAGWLSGIDRPQ